jgi:hypothetical protein
LALVAVAMDVGDGLRVTSNEPDCMSFAVGQIGDASEFRGPDFSMGMRFKLIDLGASGSCKICIATAAGVARRQTLNLDFSGSQLGISAFLDTTACGFEIQHAEFVTKDTDEHSVWWTYDGDGNTTLYYDGVSLDSVAATCPDISEPSDVDDVFAIFGSTTTSEEVCYVDEVGFSNEVLTALQIADIHANGV